IFDSRLFTDYIREIEVDYTTARHFMLRNGRTYMVGAISRLNVNHEMLCEEAMELLNGHEIEFPCYSPFGNIVAQVLEIIHFTVQSISLIDEILDMYPFKSSVEVTPREGIGLSVTEAPRGLLLHTYELDSNGRVQSVNIITPTAQNLENLEADVKAYIEYLIAKGDIENLKHRIEMLTRAYDPCMSCSARFAKAR
ncbi:Ni/Fe hydrogenase subunit alpha, partial [archaeon]